MLRTLRFGPRLLAMALQSLTVALVPLVVTTPDVARHQAGVSLIALGTFVAGWELYILTSPLLRDGVPPHRILVLNAPTQVGLAALLAVPITLLSFGTGGVALLALTLTWLLSSVVAQESTRLLYARGAVGSAGLLFLLRPCGPLLLIGAALAFGRTVTVVALVAAWTASSVVAMTGGILLTCWRVASGDLEVTSPPRRGLFIQAVPFIFAGAGVRVVLVIEAVALAQLADSPVAGTLAAGLVVTTGIQAFYDALVLIPLQGRLLATSSADAVLRTMWRQTLFFVLLAAPLAFGALEALRWIWQYSSFPHAAWSLLLLAALVLVASSPWHAQLLHARRGPRLAIWASASATVAAFGAFIAVLSGSVILVALAKLLATACLALGRIVEVRRLDRGLPCQLP